MAVLDNIRIRQNRERYTLKSDGNWEVSATSEAAIRADITEIPDLPGIVPVPLSITSEGTEPEWIPLLEVDGVVIKISDKYIISQATLDSIRANRSPHWDVIARGRTTIGGGDIPIEVPTADGKTKVISKATLKKGGTEPPPAVNNRDVIIGQTIPVIELKFNNLLDLGINRDKNNAFAGVRGVEYVHKTDLINGVPRGIIDQINWTLNPDRERPADTFSYYQVPETGDYSIEVLKTDAAQPDGSLDKEKLKTFITGVAERVNTIKEDFNRIKRLFYFGEAPEGAVVLTNTQRAVEGDEANPGVATVVVISTKVGEIEFGSTPAELLANNITEQIAAIGDLATTQSDAVVAATAADEGETDNRPQRIRAINTTRTNTNTTLERLRRERTQRNS
jgi:hypothetical protein